MKYHTTLFNLVCCSLLILGVQKWGVNSVLSHHAVEKNSQTNISQPLAFKQLPSFGLRNLLANYEFIRFLLYFGDEEIRHTGYEQSPDLLEAVISKDPYFMDFYLFLSQSTTIYSGKPDKTIEIINEGLSLINGQYPADGYRIWRYKAIDELLFLGDITAAQKSYEEAGNLATQSSDPYIQSVGHSSLRTASFLLENPDSKQARVSAWGSLMTTTFSNDARQRAAEEIRQLGGEIIFNENGGISVKYEPAVQQPSQDESNT